MDELTNIKDRYDKRKKFPIENTIHEFYFNWYIQKERELVYAEILRKHFGSNLSQVKFMEIGAGAGDNIFFFARRGIQWQNIWANELLDDRFEILKFKFPGSNLYKGDASQLDFNQEFDIVFQSTVFTSILDAHLKQTLAAKMLEMTKPGGLILWYDFKYNNPSNKDVKGVGKKEIRELFSEAQTIEFINTTLAPPIGRRIKKLYQLVNFIFPFFKTHLVAVIKK